MTQTVSLATQAVSAKTQAVSATAQPAPPLEEPLCCSYSNGRDRMVIVRCLGPDAFFLERVLFPFEQLSFQCPAGSDVEIWSHTLGGPELVEQFPAETVHCYCV